VQEETTYLGVPCLTARPNTERPVTITHGTNSLVASETGALIEAAQGKLATRVASQPPPLWDGQTAVRIADLLQSL
jgi:UDP-N-acetylglucosamine 2-epimerase (non-hydrolysing)